MPNNKKHHFVPKFYMKFFSPDGKSINLLHIKGEEKRLSIPFKNQCYRDYFYGEDGKQEKILGKIESAAAEAIRNLINSEVVPLPSNADFQTILVYLIVQAFRTAHQVDTLNDMMDQFAKHLVKDQFEQKFPDGDMSGVNIKLNNASNIGVDTAISSYTLLCDMGWLLVSANENSEYITGDTPVLLANPFLKQINGLSNTGLSTKGLLIILPICPKKTLILFDRDVYRLNGMQISSPVALATSKDVENLNILQAASCYENFYFLGNDFDANLIFSKAKRYRRTKKNVQRIIPTEETEHQRKELLITSQEGVNFPLELSFLKIRKEANRWLKAFSKQRFKPAVIDRNPEISALHREYNELQKRGIQVPPILEFLKRKLGNRIHPTN